MSKYDLDPHELLSLVEGEILGDQVADDRLPDDRVQRLHEIIRSNPSMHARYVELRASVRALHGLPSCDAPASVWNQLDSAYDQVAAHWPTRIPALAPATVSRRRGRLVSLGHVAERVSRSRKAWIAAACLLVFLMAGFLVSRTYWTPAASAPDRILFVQGRPVPANVPPGVAVARFQTRILKRYQGVRPETIRNLLDTPVADY